MATGTGEGRDPLPVARWTRQGCATFPIRQYPPLAACSSSFCTPPGTGRAGAASFLPGVILGRGGSANNLPPRSQFHARALAPHGLPTQSQEREPQSTGRREGKAEGAPRVEAHRVTPHRGVWARGEIFKTVGVRHAAQSERPPRGTQLSGPRGRESPLAPVATAGAHAAPCGSVTRLPGRASASSRAPLPMRRRPQRRALEPQPARGPQPCADSPRPHRRSSGPSGA